jgi:hypothetical protein
MVSDSVDVTRHIQARLITCSVDLDKDSLGPYGEEFITALQKFMSSFLRSQRGPVTIEVEVNGAFSVIGLLRAKLVVLISTIL